MRVEPGRPWPPTGLTTAAWAWVEPEVVALVHLTLTQAQVCVKTLLEIAAGVHEPHTGDEYPNVVRWDGRLYVEDGHHRILYAWLSGSRYTMARIYDAPLG